ncbi:toll/interleukin-1 receptor domain-containing protein [Candidatus Electronema sp. PJ]|uniref:toll/interleukin-1 receptor domain-containing protein n=1 Tax=Candidatus Electronema sp. PJ TaxID=3401572 RepID=UPI003AA997F7
MSRTALAFMSYVNEDDRHDNGWMTQFRERLSGEVRMHTGEPFDIFQDRKDIAWGQQWQERINQSLDAVTFLIPILTPAFFKSTACRDELERFLKREETLGRSDLILPVYYVSCPVLQDKAKREHDKLAKTIAARQYADWRELRFEDFTSPQLRKALAKMAQQIMAALELSRKESACAAAHSANAAKETPQVEKSGKEPASSSNTFQSKGGEQNIAQGSNAIGTQINYYGPQVLPPDKPKNKPVVRKVLIAAAFMSVALLVGTYYSANSISHYTDSSDKDRNDWERLSRLGEGGLTYYLYQHSNGKWADEARARIERLRKKVEDVDAKRPLNMVTLDSPDIIFTFLSTGNTYHSGEAFPPPKTIDCSRLRLAPNAFKDAIKAGALIVEIKAPPEAKLIKSIGKDGKENIETVKIKPTYIGVLALCNVSDKAKGPDSRRYWIRGLDEYLAKGKNGLVSVVGAMLSDEDQGTQEILLKELIENMQREMGFAYQYADSSSFSWMLWLTDQTATFID